MNQMIQVIYNPQSSMCKTALRKVLKNDLPERDEMNYVELDMGKERLIDLANECESLPLGYDKKAVVAENFFYLEKTKTKQKPQKGDVADDLLTFFKKPDPNISLYILVYSEALDENGDFFKALKEGGAKFTVVNSFGPDQWPVVVNNFFEKRNTKINADAVKELILRVNNDYSAFLNEAMKLVTYANGETITKQTVETLVSKPLEENMFELSNALTRGDKKKALNVYNDLKVHNTRGISLMNALVKQLTFLHQVQYLNNNGMNPQTIAKELGCSIGRANASLYSVRKMSDKCLEKAIEDLYQAELGVMTGKVDEDLAFNLFLANFSL